MNIDDIFYEFGDDTGFVESESVYADYLHDSSGFGINQSVKRKIDMYFEEKSFLSNTFDVFEC